LQELEAERIQIRELIDGIREWFKKTQLEFGWARCHEKEKEESAWATAESILALYFLGEPLSSLEIRKGFLYYYHNFPNKKAWNELVWNPATIDALPWSLRALALGKSKLTRRICLEALSALIERGNKSRRLWPDDSYYVLYTCSLTLKALGILGERRDLMKRLINSLNDWKAKDGGFGVKIEAEESDPCYTAHILETFLDLHVADEEQTKVLTGIIKSKKNDDGGWSGEAVNFPAEIGVSTLESNTESTAQCLVALLKAGEPIDSVIITKAVRWLLNPNLRDEKCGFRLTEATEVRNYATYYAGYGLLHFLILKKFYDKHPEILRIAEESTEWMRSIVHITVFENYMKQRDLRTPCFETLRFSKKFLPTILSTKSGAARRRQKILNLLDERPMDTRELTRSLGLDGRAQKTMVKGDVDFLMKVGLIFKEPSGLYWIILDYSE